MTNLTDLSDIISRLTGGLSGTPEPIFVWKDARVSGAAAAAAIDGQLISLWQYEGSLGNGAAPGAVAVPDNTTAGGLRQADPGGGRQKWLVDACAYSGVSSTGTLILYDRLLHISGLSGTNTGAQTVGGAITRYTDGIGNEMWAEIYTQVGATGTTISASYTDQGGAASTSLSETFGGTGFREAQRIIRIRPAAVDYGVQNVTSVTLAATTGTAGNFGVTIAHPLARFPLPVAGVGIVRNMLAAMPGPIEILPDACLALAWVAHGATAPQLLATFNMVEA